MQHHFIQKSLFLISVCFSLLVLLSCSEQKVKDKPQDQTSDKTLSLAKWFEANGNYINSDEVPSIVDAQLVYALRDENIMVIDRIPTYANKQQRKYYAGLHNNRQQQVYQQEVYLNTC
jgi:hypothetical protein